MNKVEHWIVISDRSGVNECVELSFTTRTNESFGNYTLGFRFRNGYKMSKLLDKLKKKFLIDWYVEGDEESRMIYTNEGTFTEAFDRLREI